MYIKTKHDKEVLFLITIIVETNEAKYNVEIKNHYNPFSQV
jgi:hypothetical protein